MSNHPNMSYCMHENTEAALGQVLEEFMLSHDEEGGAEAYIASLSDRERRSLRDLFSLACEFVENVEPFLE